jgi:hypothetical protein
MGMPVIHAWFHETSPVNWKAKLVKKITTFWFLPYRLAISIILSFFTGETRNKHPDSRVDFGIIG